MSEHTKRFLSFWAFMGHVFFVALILAAFIAWPAFVPGNRDETWRLVWIAISGVAVLVGGTWLGTKPYKEEEE